MAQSWDISDDKKTYTFHLRDNALWSDGKRVTAEDFVYSWRRFLHPATGAEYSYEMWYIVNADASTSINSVQATASKSKSRIPQLNRHPQ